MKKFVFAAACLFTLFATSCSNEEINDDGSKVVAGTTITLNATINNGATPSNSDHRMTYEEADNKLNFSWSTNEKFNLYQGTSSTAAEFSKNTDGTAFTGTAPTGGEGTYYAVYGNDISNTDGKLSVDISSQKGTNAENGITHFMVAGTDDLTQTLSFSHKLAVLKLTLTLPSEAEGTVPSVTLSGRHNKATYTLAEDSYAYEDAGMGDITATNGDAGFTIGEDHKITAYVAVFPEEVEAFQMVIYANAGDNKYMYTLKSAKTLTAGKVIPVNVSMNYNYEGYECVDLGLPSKTKWATVNVGAEKPTEYGGYYAWGETETKSTYYWSNYMGMSSNSDCGTDKDPLKDYVNNSKSIAGTEYDVAYKQWGGTWKMPTLDQIKELYNSSYCTTTWTEDYNGTKVAGRIITSKVSGYEGKSIFLPAAGYRFNSSLNVVGSYGYYWSATPYSNYVYNAYNLFFGSDSIYCYDNIRFYGRSVRPVSE